MQGVPKVVLKELNESRVWLKMARTRQIAPATAIESVFKECDELCKIISASKKTSEMRLKREKVGLTLDNVVNQSASINTKARLQGGLLLTPCLNQFFIIQGSSITDNSKAPPLSDLSLRKKKTALSITK